MIAQSSCGIEAPLATAEVAPVYHERREVKGMAVEVVVQVKPGLSRRPRFSATRRVNRHNRAQHHEVDKLTRTSYSSLLGTPLTVKILPETTVALFTACRLIPISDNEQSSYLLHYLACTITATAVPDMLGDSTQRLKAFVAKATPVDE